MTVLITLTTAGADSGPFDLYTNLDGYVSAFATGVSKSALLAGYTSAAVPDFATIIRVKSTGDCVNYIDITLVSPTTTTTTTTIAPEDCTSWYYNIDLYYCDSCTRAGGGSVSNSEPLTIGKWYYYQGFKMLIETYTACYADVSPNNISNLSGKDTCEEVICPTTTTTTTTAGCTITSSIVLAQGTSSVDACTNFGTPANRATYYTFDGSSFASTDGLNQTPICTQRASSGWYSNGIISRYFTNATGNFNTPVGY